MPVLHFCGGKLPADAASGAASEPDAQHDPVDVPSTISLRSSGELISLPVNSIVYAEIFGHELHVHTESGRIYCGRGRLSALESRLDGCGFLRCHRSFLVQLRHVRGLRRYRVTLSDGTELPVSKQNYLAIQREIAAYAASRP